MKKIIFISLFIAITAGLAGCMRKKDNSRRAEAHDLFVKSMDMAERYTDSIARCGDSATLLALCRRYDAALTRLNYSYPAGTDYEISEGENDTLQNLTDKYVLLRDSLLRNLAAKQRTDSLRQDSVIPGSLSSGIRHN